MVDILILNIDKLASIALMGATSLYFRILLVSMGQLWIKTIAHTATLMLLPILTYIITNVISGNIALSLGMVGALSIVRFRNPVRSPLELSVYFGAITMGITAAVSLLWLVFLIGAVTFVTIFLLIVSIFSKSFLKKNFFISSFAEGNALASLVVSSSGDILELDELDTLISKTITKDGITYTIADNNFQTLKDLEIELRNSSQIISLSLNR
jgi:hypothetical protein